VGSQSKEKLLEAVENLGNALKEVQNAWDFNAVKSDLNAYKRYLDSACELLDTTEEKAPGASRVIRRGMPIIDERIKGIIAEIQEKARALCKKTRGTSLEEMGLETVKQANELSTSNEIKMDKCLEMMNGILNKFSEYIPVDKRDGILEDLKKAKYLDFQGLFETTLKKLDEIYENFTIPPIITVPANKENKQRDIVRIAAIQLDFKLTNSFPPALEKKEECKQKIISSLDTAKSCDVHIACLPELCMCEEWVQDIKDRYPDMIIIGGSYYKNDFNECPVIMNMEVPPQLKKSPSRPEDPEITGKGMKSGDKLYRYETHLGTFSVLVCIDFLNYARFCDQTDIIFCPSYNEAKGVERFHEYASAHVANISSYIIISNTALFGGTSIFGQLHKDYYRGLVENGCKKGEDDSYKLCDLEKGFEGIIIADFDIVHKSPQVPTPVDSNKVIKSIKNIRKIKIS
jgi:predicted amidohydrolase